MRDARPSLPLSRDADRYGQESRGTWNQELVRCKGSAAIAHTRPDQTSTLRKSLIRGGQ